MHTSECLEPQLTLQKRAGYHLQRIENKHRTGNRDDHRQERSLWIVGLREQIGQPGCGDHNETGQAGGDDQREAAQPCDIITRQLAVLHQHSVEAEVFDQPQQTDRQHGEPHQPIVGGLQKAGRIENGDPADRL
ncbi:MAG: hypothetical protein IPG25_03330 [Proteobacteria bacterium]|nr:hypothetical protein [Pseudomonadota bacterium]